MNAFFWKEQEVQFIEVAGKKLEAACFGPAPQVAPTIVLLHEGLGSLAQWKEFPALLAETTGLGVFAWSRASYGGSDPVELPRPVDYMTQEALQSLPGVLNAIGFERGMLLGHSDGASIASVYAGSVIDHRVRGLIVMAPHYFTEPLALAAIREIKNAYLTTQMRSRLGKYHKNVDNAFYGWNDAWLHPDFVDWNIADCIDYFRVPVLAIQGEEDQYGTVAQITEIEQRCYSPVEVCLIPECRHSPHADKPGETLSSIASFCRRLARMENWQAVAQLHKPQDSA